MLPLITNWLKQIHDDLCTDGELSCCHGFYFRVASAVACGSCLCLVTFKLVILPLGFLKLF